MRYQEYINYHWNSQILSLNICAYDQSMFVPDLWYLTHSSTCLMKVGKDQRCHFQ